MRVSQRRWWFGVGRATGLWIALLSLAAASVIRAALARSEEPRDQHAMPAAQSVAEVDPHAHHRAMMTVPSFQVVQAEYSLPDVVLEDERGQAVPLHTLLSAERPLAVNFIFTSCTTICPVMTATMLQLQRELAGETVRPLFVSISIDPDYDTAAMLGAYARRFGADWTFLTGQRADVLEVLKSFQAWRGSKNNHAAVTLFRSAGADHWTRVEGLASAKQLAVVWKNNIT